LKKSFLDYGKSNANKASQMSETHVPGFKSIPPFGGTDITLKVKGPGRKKNGRPKKEVKGGM